MFSNSLDFNATNALPLTLDGLQSVSGDTFNFIGQPDGVLQLDVNDQVYSSDTVTLTNIEGRSGLITLDTNVYGQENLTITGTIIGTTGRFLTLSANVLEVFDFSATNLSALNFTATNISSFNLIVTGGASFNSGIRVGMNSTFMGSLLLGSGNSSSLYVGGRTETGNNGLRLHTPLGADTRAFIDTRMATNPSLLFRMDTGFGGTERMRLDQNGLSVGAGANTNARLVVGGNMLINGNGTVSASSGQGVYMEWNKSSPINPVQGGSFGSRGISFLLNQRGGGLGGICLGEVATNDSVTANAFLDFDGNLFLRGAIIASFGRSQVFDLNVSGGASFNNIQTLNITGTNARLLNISGTNLEYTTGTFNALNVAGATFTNITTLNITGTNARLLNISGTNVHYTTATFTNSVITGLTGTNITTGSITGTNSNFINASFGNLTVNAGRVLITGGNGLVINNNLITFTANTNSVERAQGIEWYALNGSGGIYQGQLYGANSIDIKNGTYNTAYFYQSGVQLNANVDITGGFNVAGSSTFTNIFATNARLLNISGTNLEYTTGTFNALNVAGATFTNITTLNITGTNARLLNISGTNVHYTTATFTNSDITELTTTNIKTTSVTGTNARLLNISGTNLEYTTGTFNALNVASATFTNIRCLSITATNGSFETVLVSGNVGIGVQIPDKKLSVSGNVYVGSFKPWNSNDSTINQYFTPLNNSQICSFSIQTTANSQHLYYFEPSLHTVSVSGTYNVAINGDTRQQITSSSTFLNISGNRSLEIDTAFNQCALDFHSRNSTFSDFDARIVSLGGNAGGNFTGGGQLFFLATTFAFNNQITVTGGINISGGNLALTGNLNQTGSISLYKQSADTVGQTIEFYKKRGATTPANDLDALGTISGYGLNSTGTAWSEACRIRMTQQGTATANVAGRMIFNTRNQSGSLVEQITIDDRVIINKNSNNANLYLEGQTENGTNGLRLHYIDNNAYIDFKGSGDLNFRADNTNGGTTRGKITSGGVFRWGSNNNFDILADSQLSVANMSVSTTEPIVRRNAGNFILQISSSDQRIKQNIRPISDEYTYDAFRKIKPVIYDTHKYVDNGAKDVLGFIAQDLAEILPPSSIHKHKIINKCEACRDCGENCEHPEKCDCLYIEDCMSFNQDAVTALNSNGVRILMRDMEILQRDLIAERIQYKAEKDRMTKQITKLRTDLDNVIRVLKLRGFSF